MNKLQPGAQTAAADGPGRVPTSSLPGRDHPFHGAAHA